MAQLSFSDFEKNLQRKKSRKALFLEALDRFVPWSSFFPPLPRTILKSQPAQVDDLLSRETNPLTVKGRIDTLPSVHRGNCAFSG